MRDEFYIAEIVGIFLIMVLVTVLAMVGIRSLPGNSLSCHKEFLKDLHGVTQEVEACEVDNAFNIEDN